ncbi:hypothetical protein [Nocardia aurantia]|uniref:Uncharacterized protein n=1 Tax=Nocardia aurantia TaxID=2585199 RepID=A0A7K0DN08_9NOCA|nr:hypothetical protein [Nocardia aurantia]MQY27133.1 hypothetical protein [Nocardia aurantia]
MTFKLTSQHPHAILSRRLFLAVVTGSFVFLVPWVGYLSFSLPAHHEVRQWDIAWVGFDCILVAAVGVTALFAWLRRQIFIPWAIITATLLVCDAWFDVVLDWNSSDLLLSVLTAVFGELPLAALLYYTARRLVRLSMQMAWVLTGHTEPPPPVTQFRMIDDDSWSAPPGTGSGVPPGSGSQPPGL